MRARYMPITLAAMLLAGRAYAELDAETQGFAWSSGAIPAIEVGDSLHAVGVIVYLDPRFGINLLWNEVTFWITDLVCTRSWVDEGVLLAEYSRGTLEASVDWRGEWDYGVHPPNDTVPSTFRNGVLFVEAQLNRFHIFIDPSTGQAGYEADCRFTSGLRLSAINLAPGAAGFIYGRLRLPGAPDTNLPSGYDFQMDGQFGVEILVGVESRSWSAIKQMYQD